MFFFVDKVLDFFYKQGFGFADLKPKSIVFEENIELTKKLEKKIYFYECPPQTRTSFYLILEELNDKEFDNLRSYVWNEDKAELIFTFRNAEENNFVINLYYGKISPNLKISNYKLDSFKGNDAGNSKIDKINKWNFDSGLFWLNYRSFVGKVKKSKSIDRELIFTLERLKKDLSNVINNDEIVQALIDRTLYIKYLEDNHIINSYFYAHYFRDSSVNYKELLLRNDVLNVNNLFRIINDIFNNYLFVTPEIDQEYLNETVFDLIYHSISGTNLSGQLSLFDFKFNVIPVEFISYIYEVFLKEEQKKNGIFYTPKKLAQLIVDDVIIDGKIGRVLDPSCGSGMFLIVAFQKLLENNPIKSNKVAEKIEHRIRLLSENIFGIEKRSIAQRFTIFSLSLQIFRDLDPDEIKEFINKELRDKNRVDLFGNYSFFENIICRNSLDISDYPFSDILFDYIVGNPPFFEIKNTDDEITFITNYKVILDSNEVMAKEIVGSHQISQCFFLKIKDWSNINTRFGFVSNNSNFYNDNSKKFQRYFYDNYCIEKIYELSKVKKILFENAKESVSAIIFSNLLRENNFIEYYPVEMGLFSEKPFELLVIQEDKLIDINQEELLGNKTRLRDFLLGNKYDKELLLKISENRLLSDYIKLKADNTQFLHRGFELWGEDARKKEFDLSKEDWKNLSSEKRDEFLKIFVSKYFTDELINTHQIPYVKPKNLEPFVIANVNRYISTLDSFHRPRTSDIYEGDKIILSRLGDNLNAVYSKEKIFFDFSVYILKLSEKNLYYLITAILNSELCNYFINQYLRKRVNDSFPRIGIEDIKNIPIPKDIDLDLAQMITEISRNITECKYGYNQVKNELNNLIFDLYKLTYLEKIRVKDYFKKKGKIKPKDLINYSETIKDSISIYFESYIDIRYHHYKDFNLAVIGVYFNSVENNPTTEKVAKFLLNEIFEQKPDENFLASQEIIYAKDCIYIIRKDDVVNWTETKAYEDGQEILNRV